MPRISPVDRAALQACLSILEADAHGRNLTAGRSWHEAARFAAHVVQRRALHLKPWQSTPSQVDIDDPDDDQAAALLLQRMLAGGISKFDPDPLAALKQWRRK